MKRFKVLMLSCALLFLSVSFAHAQQYAAEIGAGFDTSLAPHTTADAGILLGDGTNWSYSRIVARGPQDKRFTFLFESGYRRKLKDFYGGKLEVYLEGLGGLAQNSEAVSGEISGKGGVIWHKTPSLSFDLGAGIMHAPVDNGPQPAFTLRVMLTPKQ